MQHSVYIFRTKDEYQWLIDWLERQGYQWSTEARLKDFTPQTVQREGFIGYLFLLPWESAVLWGQLEELTPQSRNDEEVVEVRSLMRQEEDVSW